MTTAKFTEASTNLRERLAYVLQELDRLTDGLGNNMTADTVEQAANATGAAMRLLELAEMACPERGFVP